jgi:hypothetical protein
MTPRSPSPLAPLALALAACGPAVTTPPALRPEVQQGPAAGARPGRVLVLPAACGSVEHRCPKTYITAVDTIIRSGLEFAGYSLVEGEGLRNQTRQRHEEHGRTTTTTSSQSSRTVEKPLGFDEHAEGSSQSTTTTETSFVVLDGPNFEDLSIDERHAVLDKSGADAVVSVRIVIGGQVGVWVPDQNVEVMVKLGVNRGDAMAWASRCMASSNDFSTVDAALENAARCAIFGATGR